MIALSDQNADLVESYSYDVFGKPSNTSDVNNPYLFTGRRYDNETGLYYYRARYYDYATGRFLQTDPIRYASGLNLYSYVGNNPLNWVDPLGLMLSTMGGGNVELVKALAYSYETNRSMEVIDALISAKETYYIETGISDQLMETELIPPKENLKQPYIKWAPTAAGVSANMEFQSPAVKLYHDLEHLYDWILHGKFTLSEMDIITGPEAELAKRLGEDVRTTHKGKSYRTVDPRSIEPADLKEFFDKLEQIQEWNKFQKGCKGTD